MQTNSMTITLARVADHIRQRYGGKITKADLLLVLSEYGVNQEAVRYIGKMVDWDYLYYDYVGNRYCLTDESKQMATITITVPRLNSKEVRRDLVGRYAGYDGVIEISEVEV
jgi:hypothetical protein